MKRLIIFTITILIVFNLVAMNKPKAMCVYIEMPDESAPPFASVSFSAYIYGRSSEILTDSSPGCGYIENISTPEAGTGDGICYLNIGSFETAWSSEEHLMWTIELNDSPYGIVNQQIQDETGASEYSYELDPYNLAATPLPVTLSSFMAVYNEGVPVLNWVTQSEISNSGWNIYRSETEECETILQINPELISGGGTTTETISYSFTDNFDVTPGITYWYSLESVDFGGHTDSFGPIMIQIPNDENQQPPEIPPVFGLHCNYPNPFNPDTVIEFTPETAGKIDIKILNIKGQIVKTILTENFAEEDIGKNQTCVWDGTNYQGKIAGSGIYFCRYKSTTRNQITKMVLIK